MVAEPIRDTNIDGVRGWAALSVMCLHMVGILTVADPTSTSLGFRVFLNGELDVAVFFVLSGDALSAAYWRTGSVTGVVRLAIKRYPRLTIPIFFSGVIMFVLLQSGLAFTHEAAAVLRHKDWLGAVLAIEYGWPDLLSFAFTDVYFRHSEAISLNPPLWTMRFEMLGSILVFLYLLCDRHIGRKTVTLVALIVLLLASQSFLACFFFGVLFGRWRVGGLFGRLQHARWAVSFVAYAGACLLLAANIPIGGAARATPVSLVAAGFVFCVLASPHLTSLFGARPSQWLGRISFPLYLVHFSVLASFSSGMVVWAHDNGRLDLGMIWLIVISSISLSLLVAVAFEPVEQLTRKIGDRLCRFVVAGAP